MPFGDIFNFEIVRVLEQSGIFFPLLSLASREFLVLPLALGLALRGAIGTEDVLYGADKAAKAGGCFLLLSVKTGFGLLALDGVKTFKFVLGVVGERLM